MERVPKMGAWEAATANRFIICFTLQIAPTDREGDKTADGALADKTQTQNPNKEIGQKQKPKKPWARRMHKFGLSTSSAGFFPVFCVFYIGLLLFITLLYCWAGVKDA